MARANQQREAVLARFGYNLAQARARAGLSQEGLAALAGLSQGEISRVERSERDPGITVVVRLADALGLGPGDLLDGIWSSLEA